MKYQKKSGSKKKRNIQPKKPTTNWAKFRADVARDYGNQIKTRAFELYMSERDKQIRQELSRSVGL